MSKNCLKTYKPYRSYFYFVPFMLGGCLLFLIFAGVSFADGDYREMLGFAVLAGICLFLTKCLYDPSQVTVLLGADGISLTTKKNINAHFIPWETIKYGYVCANFKDHRFLILSGKVLSKEERTQLIRKETHSSATHINGMLVLHLDPAQDTSGLLDEIVARSGICLIEDH